MSFSTVNETIFYQRYLLGKEDAKDNGRSS